jgi:uncharacterized small protein (DUF1192 family)
VRFQCAQQAECCVLTVQEAELLRPRVPALEAEVARLQVEVQDRNKGLRDAQNEEGLARAQVSRFTCPELRHHYVDLVVCNSCASMHNNCTDTDANSRRFQILEGNSI